MIAETERRSHRKSETRGCADLGSSNFRLLVLEAVFPRCAADEAGVLEIHAVREERRFVGWGDDLARSGSISPEKERLAARAIRELLGAAGSWGCPRPALFATNTLREARNAGVVRDRLEGAIGAPIRVLSRREEAELGYVGAAFFRPRSERVLLVDAGGTSTEISWGTGTSMAGCVCLPLGTHRVRRLLARGTSPRLVTAMLARSVEGAAERMRGERGVYPLPGAAGESTMLLTGGTAVSLAILHRRVKGGTGGFEEMHAIPRGDFELIQRRVAGLRRAGRERTLPFEAERIDLFPAGLALVGAVVRGLGADRFTVTARDARWGSVLTGGASE